MESKWYLFPGQTHENTRISDRAHALHITKKSWDGITQHLDRRRRMQEALDKEKAHKEALKLGSQAMTKEWADSLENLRLRKEKERYDRLHQKKEVIQMEMFNKLRAEQEVLRQEYVEKMKRDAFRSKGYPKELTTALMTSETLYERQKQVEFNDMLKQHDMEVKRKHGEYVIAQDKREREEDAEQKRKNLNKGRDVAESNKQKMDLQEFASKEEKRAQVERRLQDRLNAEKEEQLIKQFELDQKQRKRQQTKLEKIKEMKDERLRQQVLMKENAELEKATAFYSEAKKRIDCLLKIKEKELLEASIAKRDEIACKVAAIRESKEGEEDARIAKTIADQDAEEQARQEAKIANKRQAAQERIEDRNQYLERLEQEKRVKEEMKKWELLNRVKAKEAMQEYDEQTRKKKWAKILAYRKELLDQIDEEKEAAKEEKEIEEIMNRVSFEEGDRMFFEYADEVMQLAERKNRSTYPIEKVIMEYKRVNGLLPPDWQRRCYSK